MDKPTKFIDKGISKIKKKIKADRTTRVAVAQLHFKKVKMSS
jgi:hypothetical protein